MEGEGRRKVPLPPLLGSWRLPSCLPSSLLPGSRWRGHTLAVWTLPRFSGLGQPSRPSHGVSPSSAHCLLLGTLPALQRCGHGHSQAWPHGLCHHLHVCSQGEAGTHHSRRPHATLERPSGQPRPGGAQGRVSPGSGAVHASHLKSSLGSDGCPIPARLTAAILNSYNEPSAKPST